MRHLLNRPFLLSVLGLSIHFNTGAQSNDKRFQIPKSLAHSYFGFNMGYIQYPFSAEQLEPGFTVQSVIIPHLAPRFFLYGYRFNKYISARISYMRPRFWVKYRSINGDKTDQQVLMNIGGITMASRIPFGKKFSIFGEAGLGIITRKGFEYNGRMGVRDLSFNTGLFGLGAQFNLGKNWDLQFHTAWSPENKKEKQPKTSFYALGFNYQLKKLTEEKIEKLKSGAQYFPGHLIQASVTTNAIGYGVNTLFAKNLGIFWGGDGRLKKGVSVHYQRTFFRGKKFFSLDWGAGMGIWESRKYKDRFFTASVYPVLRFTVLRSPKTDLFFDYSVAGPSYISKTIIDSAEIGKRFIFYDAMGIGMFSGKKKTFHAAIRIAHFSNGNIFTRNDGVMIPLTFSVGYAFPNKSKKK